MTTAEEEMVDVEAVEAVLATELIVSDLRGRKVSAMLD